MGSGLPYRLVRWLGFETLGDKQKAVI